MISKLQTLRTIYDSKVFIITCFFHLTQATTKRLKKLKLFQKSINKKTYKLLLNISSNKNTLRKDFKSLYQNNIKVILSILNLIRLKN